MCVIHLSSIITLVNITLEMTKPVQPPVVPEIGRNELPDNLLNEIVIELDPGNHYAGTQPRANEPQGKTICAIQKLFIVTSHAVNITFNLQSRESFPPPPLLIICDRAFSKLSSLTVLHSFSKADLSVCLQLILSTRCILTV